MTSIIRQQVYYAVIINPKQEDAFYFDID